jgi:tRNA A37 methylthiotransferase MiaB
MRVRFTSPHPKNFPTELLHLIAERPNLCKSIHMPIQSGSNTVLERMRRGYTREAYLRLVEEMRSIIPNVWISSDFITGFCDETEQEHRDTISLMETVQYDMAYMFAYRYR